VVKNDFEDHLLDNYPQIADIKERLYHLGAAFASMTGSGSTVYGIFKTPIDLPAEWTEYQVWKSW
jgi:4-diphosphocytidyl-2-C-methyl-D-erythritol kinase